MKFSLNHAQNEKKIKLKIFAGHFKQVVNVKIAVNKQPNIEIECGL